MQDNDNKISDIMNKPLFNQNDKNGVDSFLDSKETSYLSMSNNNNFYNDFELDYRDDGVYFNVEKVYKSGKALDTISLLNFIKRKNIGEVSISKITHAFSSLEEPEVIIAPFQEEIVLNEEILVELRNHKMEAYAEILPGEAKGTPLTLEDAIAILNTDFGVNYNIDNDTIKEMLENKIYYEKRLIASGTLPTDGKNGELIFKFDKNVGEAFKLRYMLDGKINFREVNKIINVLEDQVLVERILATEGADGYYVSGEKIAAKNGKDVMLPKGKNIYYSEDKCILYSKITGNVTYSNAGIVVMPVFTVVGDVDMSVGNIEFIGDVLIKGNVNSGFVIKAGGSITINGIVESAVLECKGDIIIIKGVVGADKALLKTEGNVVVKFLQRANVIADKKVCADFIMHSNVMSDSVVEVMFEHGSIMGGITRARRSVAARNIGGISHIATYIEIGISPNKRERYDIINTRLLEVQSMITRLEVALHSKKGSLNSVENSEAKFNCTIKLLQLKRENDELLAEFKEITQEIISSGVGSINISEKVHSGVKLAIGDYTKVILSQEAMVTYVVDEDRIVSVPYKYDIIRKEFE